MEKQSHPANFPPVDFGLTLKMQGWDGVPLVDLWETYSAGRKWTVPERVSHAQTFFAAAAATLEALEKAGGIEGRATKRRTLLAHAQRLAANCIEWAKSPDAKRLPTN